MLHFPNAKINIGLSVTEKRADGYHNLETVFFPLPMLKDALEVIPAQGPETSFRLSGKKVAGEAAQNLVLRAYELLKAAYPDRISPLSIHLLKTIPMGAGLGGGSSDGAFMLRLLNKFFELGLQDSELARHALELGSDCPFFIYNTPHFARGRGELLEPVSLDISMFSIQLVCPAIHVSTATAFSKIIPKPASFGLGGISALPVAQWKDQVVNDFEAPVFAVHPELALIKKRLYDEGALYAAMSGTGSAIYGIFREGERSSIVSGDGVEVFYFE